MTRIEKYAHKRALIEKENKEYAKQHPYEYMMILCSQKQIKQEGGYKH